MLIYNNLLELYKLQVSFFTPNFTFSSTEVLKKLINMEQNIFDGDPIMLPLPADAPFEIPRITLESKDKKYKLEIAPIRINIFRNKINEDDKIKPDDCITLTTSLIPELLESLGVQCDRIAIVIDRNSINDNAAEEIASHFCKDKFLDEPFDRPSEFEIHSLKKYLFLENFEINSWVRFRSTHLRSSGGILRPTINIHQDINTIAESTRIYSRDDINTFYKDVLSEFNKILKLYIPN